MFGNHEQNQQPTQLDSTPKKKSSPLDIDIIKAGEAARMFGCTIRCIDLWATKGLIPGHKIGFNGKWKFSKKTLLPIANRRRRELGLGELRISETGGDVVEA
jgi:hypothetical protein